MKQAVHSINRQQRMKQAVTSIQRMKQAVHSINSMQRTRQAVNSIRRAKQAVNSIRRTKSQERVASSYLKAERKGRDMDSKAPQNQHRDRIRRARREGPTKRNQSG